MNVAMHHTINSTHLLLHNFLPNAPPSCKRISTGKKFKILNLNFELTAVAATWLTGGTTLRGSYTARFCRGKGHSTHANQRAFWSCGDGSCGPRYNWWVALYVCVYIHCVCVCIHTSIKVLFWFAKICATQSAGALLSKWRSGQRHVMALVCMHIYIYIYIYIYVCIYILGWHMNTIVQVPAHSAPDRHVKFWAGRRRQGQQRLRCKMSLSEPSVRATTTVTSTLRLTVVRKVAIYQCMRVDHFLPTHQHHLSLPLGGGVGESFFGKTWLEHGTLKSLPRSQDWFRKKADSQGLCLHAASTDHTHTHTSDIGSDQYMCACSPHWPHTHTHTHK